MKSSIEFLNQWENYIKKITNLSIENENLWDEIRNRDDEIEVLNDNEAILKSKIKSLKKKEKWMNNKLKNSYPADKVNEILWDLMGKMNELKENNEIENEFLYSLLDELEEENKSMKINFRNQISYRDKFFNDKIDEKNKEIKSKDKIINKLETKLIKLQEKLDSFKEKLKSKCFPKKRDFKIKIKEIESTEDSSNSNMPKSKKETITEITTNSNQEIDIKIKNGERSTRIFNIIK